MLQLLMYELFKSWSLVFITSFSFVHSPVLTLISPLSSPVANRLLSQEKRQLRTQSLCPFSRNAISHETLLQT